MKKVDAISAIYCIENIVTKKKYVGATDNLKERWLNHKIDLRNETHKNSFIQEDYNKFGLDSFLFYVLEYCDPENLITKEMENIERMKTMYYHGGYNISFGNEISDLTKKRISMANSGKISRIGKRKKNPTSKYLGVYVYGGRYYSQIYLLGQRYNVGNFETEVEAAMAYNEYAQELLGWKATLNIIPKEEIEKAWSK